MQTFTVLGFYEADGQICSDVVDAVDGEAALCAVANKRIHEGGDAGYNLIAAVRGNFTEEKDVVFPGDSVTDCKTYLTNFEDFPEDV